MEMFFKKRLLVLNKKFKDQWKVWIYVLNRIKNSIELLQEKVNQFFNLLNYKGSVVKHMKNQGPTVNTT